MTDDEKRQRILDLQCPSTRKALERPESEDELWLSRPFANCIAVPDANTMEEYVGARAISYEEAKVYNGLRYNRGEYIAEMRREETPSSVTEEKRERGMVAFMKMTFKDLLKATGLSPLFEKPETLEQRLMRDLDKQERRIMESVAIRSKHEE